MYAHDTAQLSCGVGGGGEWVLTGTERLQAGFSSVNVAEQLLLSRSSCSSSRSNTSSRTVAVIWESCAVTTEILKNGMPKTLLLVLKHCSLTQYNADLRRLSPGCTANDKREPNK